MADVVSQGVNNQGECGLVWYSTKSAQSYASWISQQIHESIEGMTHTSRSLKKHTTVCVVIFSHALL